MTAASRYIFCNTGPDFSTALLSLPLPRLSHKPKGDLWDRSAHNHRSFPLNNSAKGQVAAGRAGSLSRCPRRQLSPPHGKPLVPPFGNCSRKGKVDMNSTTSGKFHEKSRKPTGELMASGGIPEHKQGFKGSPPAIQFPHPEGKANKRLSKHT